MMAKRSWIRDNTISNLSPKEIRRRREWTIDDCYCRLAADIVRQAIYDLRGAYRVVITRDGTAGKYDNHALLSAECIIMRVERWIRGRQDPDKTFAIYTRGELDPETVIAAVQREAFASVKRGRKGVKKRILWEAVEAYLPYVDVAGGGENG